MPEVYSFFVSKRYIMMKWKNTELADTQMIHSTPQEYIKDNQNEQKKQPPPSPTPYPISELGYS